VARPFAVLAESLHLDEHADDCFGPFGGAGHDGWCRRGRRGAPYRNIRASTDQHGRRLVRPITRRVPGPGPGSQRFGNAPVIAGRLLVTGCAGSTSGLSQAYMFCSVLVRARAGREAGADVRGAFRGRDDRAVPEQWGLPARSSPGTRESPDADVGAVASGI